MPISNHTRLLLTWFGLSAITLLAWWLGAHHSSGPLKPNVAVGLGAIAITAIKVLVIMREFMDVRNAPARLRFGSLGLLVIFVVAMTLAYLW